MEQQVLSVFLSNVHHLSINLSCTHLSMHHLLTSSTLGIPAQNLVPALMPPVIEKSPLPHPEFPTLGPLPGPCLAPGSSPEGLFTLSTCQERHLGVWSCACSQAPSERGAGGRMGPVTGEQGETPPSQLQLPCSWLPGKGLFVLLQDKACH